MFLRKISAATYTKNILEKADNIVEGKFDLLGFEQLDFGKEVDWHLEPISGKRSPLKHWKQFDELDTNETGDKKIVWELNRHQHFFTLGLAYGFTKMKFMRKHLQSILKVGWSKIRPGSESIG